MAEQERQTTRRHIPESDEATTAKNTSVAEKAEKLKRTMDEILDEIDSVLEKNAEEFVKSYVQRGGQ
jgi:ubiquitin-like protein Pup